MAEITGMRSVAAGIPLPSLRSQRQPLPKARGTADRPVALAGKPLRAKAPQPKELKPVQIEEVFKRLSLDDFNKYLRLLNMSTNLFAIQTDIRYDEITHGYRVTIRNTETGKIIREIPPWDISKIVEYIRELVGSKLNIVA